MKVHIILAALTVSVSLAPAVARAQIFSLTREQMIEYTAQNPFDRFPDGRPKVNPVKPDASCKAEAIHGA